MKASTLVVIPTYNEAENIEAILDAVLAANPEAQLLIVDDGSPDGTGEIAEQRSSTDSRIHLLHHGSKRGLGRAYVAGFLWGLAREFDRFIEIDADFSHDPAAIPNLLAGASNADAVIGSRYVPGGRVEGWSWGRHLLSRAGNLYARIILGFPVRDSTSGFRCYKRSVLEAVELRKVDSQGYAFQIDMTYRAWRLGCLIAEIPITFTERREGRSKMSRRIVAEALLSLTWWGLRDLILLRRWRRAPPEKARLRT